MIVDTSVFFAILAGEPEEPIFKELLLGSTGNAVSAGSWIELSAVLAGRFPTMPIEQPEQLRQAMRVEIAPVTAEQAAIGFAAYRAFGRGSGSSARLNLGDCFAYALAKATGEPLLFKGDDFGHTDVVRAGF
jgi:ribonuclease VapC